jgi:hypothetical protein
MASSRGPAGSKKKRAKDKKPVSDTVPFCLDMELADALDRALAAKKLAEAQHKRLQDSTDALAVAGSLERLRLAEDALEASQAAVEAETFRVRLVAIPRENYLKMMARHPATEDQQTEYIRLLGESGALEGLTETELKQQKLQFDTDTYPRALIRACAPDLEDEDLDAFFDPMGTWSQPDVDELFQRSIAVCQRSAVLRR